MYPSTCEVWLRLQVEQPVIPTRVHVPSTFFTMCRGEAQLLLDLWMIPCFSSSANSFLAASSLLYLAVTGQPTVTRKCCTRCVGLGSALDLLSTLGNLSSTCCRLGLVLGASAV